MLTRAVIIWNILYAFLNCKGFSLSLISKTALEPGGLSLHLQLLLNAGTNYGSPKQGCLLVNTVKRVDAVQRIGVYTSADESFRRRKPAH